VRQSARKSASAAISHDSGSTTSPRRPPEHLIVGRDWLNYKCDEDAVSSEEPVCRCQVNRALGVSQYVVAMWQMLQQPQPRDFVIATGKTVSLKDFVDSAFKYFGLDWQKYVEHQPSLIRPSEIRRGHADPRLAFEAMGWKAQVEVDQVVVRMIEAQLSLEATTT